MAPTSAYRARKRPRVSASLSVMAVHLAVRWSVRDHTCIERSVDSSAESAATFQGPDHPWPRLAVSHPHACRGEGPTRSGWQTSITARLPAAMRASRCLAKSLSAWAERPS